MKVHATKHLTERGAELTRELMNKGIKAHYPPDVVDFGHMLFNRWSDVLSSSGRGWHKQSPLTRAAWCEVAKFAVESLLHGVDFSDSQKTVDGKGHPSTSSTNPPIPVVAK